MTHLRWRLLSLSVILLAVGVALLPYLRLSINVPGAVVSPAAQRAMQTIYALSQSPRGMGTPNHAAAQVFLSDRLHGLGFEVETQEAAVPGAPVPLVNIIGRLAGQDPGQQAVLLVAHYDADPANCPGAVDNASGVAVVLEIARAAAGGPRPANDLIVLFTDGEELGVLGAPQFLGHAWAQSVKVALNFDALSIGPVFLWQTSPHNGRLIETYARTPNPAAASWIDSIGRVLPLDTDFRPLMEAGITGASFTSPYLPVTIHTALDQPQLVNPLTIEHGISQGVALTRDLLDQDLSRTTGPDRAYLNLLGGWFVHFPAAAATAAGLLAGLVALAAVTTFAVRKTVRLKAVGSGLLFSAANLMLVLWVQVAVEIVLLLTQPLLAPWIKIPLSLAVLSLLLSLAYRRLEKRAGPLSLMLGGQLLWAILAVWSSLANPLFSPLLTLILLASLLPYGLLPLRASRPGLYRAAWAAALALILLLGAPVVYLLYMISGLIIYGAAFGAVAWALLLGLVQPAGTLLAAGSGAEAAQQTPTATLETPIAAGS